MYRAFEDSTCMKAESAADAVTGDMGRYAILYEIFSVIASNPPDVYPHQRTTEAPIKLRCLPVFYTYQEGYPVLSGTPP